ncbi:MAG TPA: serine hydrolase domain-containing protein [Candidatus Acidoferrum sp.]|nr:serine hydrolase domain-containing protein [Candidatus Acidoferrum sp.]
MNNILSRTSAVLGALVLGLGLPSAALADALSSGQVTKIDAIVGAAMAKQHLVGVEVAVGRNGGTLFVKGYGLRDKAKGLPVTANTVFPTGSIGKQFTAACVMLLVQQGKVNLDSKVARYLPAVPHASEITVRELLNQTSGLHDYLENKALVAALFGGTWMTHHPSSYYVGLTKGDPLAFKPGTKWQYSNTNYEILGMLVAKVSGESYEQFVTDNIFKAQGLDSMQYLTWSIPVGDDVTRGYTYAKGANTQLPRYDMSWGGSAGALASNASDLVKWDGAFFGGKVISATNVTVATTPPHGITMGMHSGNTQSQIASGYGFGWVIGKDEGRTIIWHNGGIVGARTMNATFPADGLEIVVLTNATTADPEIIALKIARLLYGG